MPPRSAPLAPGLPLARSAWPPRSVLPAARPRPVAATRTRDTGFSAAVKLDTRKRAGLGDIDAAVCEACAIWLGRYGGQVQHIVARMMGGRGPKAPWWMWTVVDAALLCGTPETGDHGLCESRAAAMGPDGFGFWLPSTASPLAAPMTLYGRRPGRGIEVWRTADGKYSDQAPGTGAAA